MLLNQSKLSRSDIYSWALSSSKPYYNWSEIQDKPITYPPSNHNHDDRYWTSTTINNKITDCSSNNNHDSANLFMRRNYNTNGRNNNSYFYLQPGTYTTFPGTTGATDYGVILCVRAQEDWIFQMWFTTSNHLYTRQNINSKGFSDWKTIY